MSTVPDPAHPVSDTDADPAEAPDSGPTWLDHGRIPCLDGLRTLSIGLVLVEHTAVSTGVLRRGLIHDFFGTVGSVGVDVFFAISGFLITLLLLREKKRSGYVSLKRFYVRRFLRLMPASIAFLITMALFQWAGHVRITNNNWLHVLTYTVNFDLHPSWDIGHLWSLSIEEQFYVAWPIAMLLLTTRSARRLAITWLVVAIALRCALYVHDPSGSDHYELWTPVRIDSIAAGCLLALLADSPRFRRHTRLASRPAALLVLLCGIGIFASHFLALRVAVFEVVIENTWRAACIAGLIWFTLNHASSWWASVLEMRALIFVGLLSYSLYLWQQPFFDPRSHHWVTRFPINLVFAMILALSSYYLIERPFLRLKDRLEKPKEDLSEEPHSGSGTTIPLPRPGN